MKFFQVRPIAVGTPLAYGTGLAVANSVPRIAYKRLTRITKYFILGNNLVTFKCDDARESGMFPDRNERGNWHENCS